MARLRWFVLALVTSGCGRSVALPLPPSDASAELLLVSVVGAPERDRLIAVDVASPASALDLSLTTSDDVTFEAVTYLDDLCTLGWTSGVVERTSESGRCVPEPDAAFTARIEDGGEPSTWAAIATPDFVRTQAVRGPGCAGTVIDCLASGRCVDADARCEPCPDPRARDPIVAPSPPMDPALIPGADGWFATSLDNPPLLYADPWGPGGIGCGGGWVTRNPGDPECRLFDPCPPGRWPEGLGCVDGVLHVDPAATSPGDGSCASPYSTIAEAAAVAPDGATIALATGTHALDVFRPTGALSLVGRCVQSTRIAATSTTSGASVALDTEHDLHLGRLQWRSEDDIGLRVRGAHFSADRVGFVLGNTTLQLTDGATGEIVLSHEKAVNDSFVDVDATSSLTVRGMLIAATTNSIFVVDGGALTLEDVGISGVAFDPSARAPRGAAIHATNGARVVLRRELIEHVQGTGVRVVDGTLETSDVYINDTNAVGGEYAGAGIELINTNASLVRTFVRDADTAGVFATESTVTIVDAAVRPDAEPGDVAEGLVVIGGGVEATRVQIADASPNGIRLATTATLTDVFVSNVSAVRGASLGIAASGQLRATRLAITNVDGVGLSLDDATAIVTDLTTDDTSKTLAGRAVSTTNTRLELTRALLRERGRAFVVEGGSVVVARDVHVERDAGAAPALDIVDGDVSIVGARIGRSVASGVVVGAAGRLLLEAAYVEEHRLSEAKPAIVVAGHLNASGLEVGSGRDVGLRVCRGATVDLEHSVLRGRVSAAEVPRAFDVSAMSLDVAYDGGRFGLCDGRTDPCQ